MRMNHVGANVARVTRTFLRNAIAALVVVGLSACSMTFGDNVMEVPLLGEPIEPAAYALLNEAGTPVTSFSLMRGISGRYFAILSLPDAQQDPSLPTSRRRIQLIPLDRSGSAETLEADYIALGARMIYLLDMSSDAQTAATLRLRQPGDDGVGRRMQMPGGPGMLLPGPNDAAFVYTAALVDTNSYFLFRTSGSLQRKLPLPDGIELARFFDYSRMRFEPSGDLFLTRDAQNRMSLHATRQASDIDLGPIDLDTNTPPFFFDSGRQALWSCSRKGLRRIPLNGSAPALIDSRACNPDVLISALGGVFYKSEDAIYKTSNDGGTPTQVLPAPVGQVLALWLNHGIIYSLDPPLRYGAGIGDGWLNGWKFMNRGRSPSFSSDGRRLRWLENAARSDGTGDLYSASLAERQPRLLAYNVRQFREVAPGKILCISNAAGRGTYNRLILIDEEAQVAHWVVNGAGSFALIPSTNDVIAEIVSGPAGSELRRVPLSL